MQTSFLRSSSLRLAPLLLILTLSLTGLSGTIQEFNILVPKLFTTADPHRATTWWDRTLARLLYDRLVEITPLGETRPGLAVSWSCDPSCREWRFKIREGVHFHDGKLLLPEDVAKSIKRSVKLGRSWEANLLRRILVSINVEGDEVMIELSHPYVALDKLLSSTSFSVVRVRIDGSLIGTGPYKLDSMVGGRVTLVRNRIWWYRASRLFETLHIRLWKGGSGILMNVNMSVGEEACRIMETYSTKVHQEASEVGTVYLMFNSSRLRDVDLRKALAEAVPRGGIKYILPSGWEPVYSFAPGVTSGKPIRFDPYKASCELRKLKARGRKIHLHVAARGTPTDVGLILIGRATAKAWQKVGVKVELTVGPEVPSTADAVVFDFVPPFPDPDATYSPLFTLEGMAESATNLGFFYNSEVEKLVAAERGEADTYRREKTFRKIEDTLWKFAPGVPICRFPLTICGDITDIDILPDGTLKMWKSLTE